MVDGPDQISSHAEGVVHKQGDSVVMRDLKMVTYDQSTVQRLQTKPNAPWR